MIAVIRAAQQQGKTVGSQNVQDMVDSLELNFNPFKTS